MSRDLPPLGTHRRPGSPPRPEVLEAVVREGRRRGRRSAAVTGGALAAVAAVVLGVGLLGSGSDDALVVVPASPLPGASPVPSPAGGPPPPGPAAPPQLSPVLRGSPSPDAAPALSLPRATRQAAPAAPVVATPRVVRPYREAPERRPYSDLCMGRSFQQQEHRMCLEGAVTSQTRSGTPVDLEVSLCSSLANRRSYELSFRTGREHEVQARPAGTADDHLWTWSRGYTFPEGAHSRTLEAGWCLRWLTTWDTRDDAGRLVPPGDYLLDVGVEVDGRLRELTLRIQVTP